MQDQSHLDRKYFIDHIVYNCPFCNRNNVRYYMKGRFDFDWTVEKKCFGFIVECSSCENQSMHLTFEEITDYSNRCYYIYSGIDIDSKIFYSVPTSFFVIDSRIPKLIRELITEAEGCLKMNFLTGASACTRKAIYELLIKENAQGHDYESKIKSLKDKYPTCDPTLFDILSHIQDMTSDKIHEQSWPKWDSQYLQLIIETLKTVLHEIYVIPKIKEERSQRIQELRSSIKTEKKQRTEAQTPPHKAQ